MRINSLTYTNTPINFCAEKHKKMNNNVSFSHKPVVEGLNTAGAWFSFGVGLDFVTRKFAVFKSPLKNSLAMNGAIGAAAGLVTGYKALNKKD